MYRLATVHSATDKQADGLTDGRTDDRVTPIADRTRLKITAETITERRVGFENQSQGQCLER